jgi:anti-sigma regulatory factor (Ser/Thr protein kinase)
MIERRTFPNAAAVVAEARRFVTRRVDDADDELKRRVGLMVSELATNAVRHTSSDFTVEIERTPQHLCVRVSDRGGGEPVVRSPRVTETTGRGLQLVEGLADSFGIDHAEHEPGTKTVWFLVNLSAGRPAESEVVARETREDDHARGPEARGSREFVSEERRLAEGSRGRRARFQCRCTCHSFLPVNMIGRTLPKSLSTETRDWRSTRAGNTRCTVKQKGVRAWE